MPSSTSSRRVMLALIVGIVVVVGLGAMLLIGLLSGNHTDQLDIQNGHNRHNGEVVHLWR